MIDPQLPPESTKTYQVLQPVNTHFRDASCMEVNCPHLANGWRSGIDERTNLGQAQAYYIRHESGRKFTESRDEFGLTIFAFEAGQKCFQQHRVSLDRPARFLVKDGDFRGNPRGTPVRIHNAEDWVDDFANHQQILSDAMKEG